jgi:hypothetical protein
LFFPAPQSFFCSKLIKSNATWLPINPETIKTAGPLPNNSAPLEGLTLFSPGSTNKLFLWTPSRLCHILFLVCSFHLLTYIHFPRATWKSFAPYAQGFWVPVSLKQQYVRAQSLTGIQRKLGECSSMGSLLYGYGDQG